MTAKISRKSSLRARFVVIMTVFAGVPAATHGQGSFHSDGTAALRHAAEIALYEAYANESGRVEIEVANLDPRLNVPVCQLPLVARANSNNTQGGRVTVRVDCQDHAPWARHVSASVRIYKEIVVSARTLARGSVLSQEDLVLQEHDISALRGAVIADLNQATGMALRRAINAGNALSLDMLAAPILVARGDTVVLTAERGGIAIRQQGTALQDGEAGKQIQIRNNNSNRVVQAVVTGPGEASVMF
jgi:flagellar basal body P-ring formation protein FlgA